MTRRYQTTFSNGVSVRVKITATTGRPGQSGAIRREPGSEITAEFRGRCEPEEVEQCQAECNAFIQACCIDAGRSAGGIIMFQPVPVPVHEIVKGYPQDADQEAPSPATESDLDASLPVTSETVAGNGEVVAPGQAPPADPEEVGGANPS
jgi:hypothetical protein